jgi:hypothetical protein
VFSGTRYAGLRVRGPDSFRARSGSKLALPRPGEEPCPLGCFRCCRE